MVEASPNWLGFFERKLLNFKTSFMYHVADVL